MGRFDVSSGRREILSNASHVYPLKRLMRVYGPTKCLRHRKSKIQGNSNVLSVKRKFYRWFPDLEERFEKTDLGWYKPRIGHEAEMKYREDLRRKDQELLTLKRTAKRSGDCINLR